MGDKLAIITSGGGTKCSYGAGVMLALAEKYGLKKPDILISCSGSAGVGTYFTAGQYGSIRNIWENLLSTGRFISHARFWKTIDIDYLIDEVIKKQDPLNMMKFSHSPIKYLIPALNNQTGGMDYFSCWDKIDIFEAMRATKAMPLAFKLDPGVAVAGSTYCDSYLSSCAESHLGKAAELGAKKIILLSNYSPDDSHDFDHRMFDIWVSCHARKFRENYARSLADVNDYRLPKGVKSFLISPKNPLTISELDNNQELLRASLQQGYDETSSNKALARFLKD